MSAQGWRRTLGNTGIEISALGLGTVKLGRTQGVRYPQPFELPDDRAARALLDAAQDLGINLLDTAPAYGESEERLGRLLAGNRHRWVLSTKVGEEFANGESRFDFSARHTRASIERSLRRLRTDVIDIALVHSDGDDLGILQSAGALDTLRDLQREGLVRACGMSTKTVAGGLAAARECDVLMVAYSLADHSQQAVLDACHAAGTGVLVKKALDSGHLADENPGKALSDALRQAGTDSVVVGTLSPDHLRANAAAIREFTG